MISPTRLAAIAAAAGCCLLGVAAGAQATQSTSPSTLLSTAIKDAEASGSAHEVEMQTAKGFSSTTTADLGKTGGRELVVRPGGQRENVLVGSLAAYFSGTQAGLIHICGLPAAVARTVGSRWVSVPASSSGYGVIADGALLAYSLGAFALPGHLTETAASAIGGQPVVAIHGQGKVGGAGSKTILSTTVYVTRSAKPLPLRAVYSYSTGGQITLSLSKWGERIALTLPGNAIPISTLRK